MPLFLPAIALAHSSPRDEMMSSTHVLTFLLDLQSSLCRRYCGEFILAQVAARRNDAGGTEQTSSVTRLRQEVFGHGEDVLSDELFECNWSAFEVPCQARRARVGTPSMWSRYHNNGACLTMSSQPHAQPIPEGITPNFTAHNAQNTPQSVY